MLLRKAFLILTMLLLQNMIAVAIERVTFKNGNFFISYTDISFIAYKSDLTRVYNSKSSDKGLFGAGWGSEMDTRLYVLPDGSLIVANWGSGYKENFYPKKDNATLIAGMVKDIVQGEIKTGKLKDEPVAQSARKTELMQNAEMRNLTYMNLLQKGILSSANHPPAGKTSWYNNDESLITWENGTYTFKRYTEQYTFNKDGSPTSLFKKNILKKFTYTGNRLSGISIEGAGSCTVETGTSGKIIKLVFQSDSSKQESVYRYDEEDNLIYSKDAGDNEYHFDYDKNHNLIKITYADQSTLAVEYDALKGFATKVVERNGSQKQYRYLSFYNAEGEVDKDHYATEVKSFTNKDSLLFTGYYEYEIRTTNDAERYTYRTVIKTDTSSIEVINHPISKNAVYRRQNKKEAWADYDAKGRGIYLRLPDSVFRVEYDLLNRIKSFQAIDSIKKDSTIWRYTYDADGNISTMNFNGNIYKVIREKMKTVLADENDLKQFVIYFDEKGELFQVSLGNVEPGPAERMFDTSGKIKATYLALSGYLNPRTIPEMMIWERL